VVTQVIASSGDGHWLENAGGYSDWASYSQRNQEQDETLAAKKLVSGATGGDAVVSIAQKDGSGRRQKLGFREQRELQTLPDRIAELEAEQAGLTRRVEDPALYAEGPAEAQRLASRLTAIDAELTALLERWDSLESRNAGKE